MRIFISHMITAMLAIAISYSVIMASVDKRFKKEQVSDIVNDDTYEEPQEDDRIGYTKLDNRLIQNITVRVGKLENFVAEISPMIDMAKNEYDKLKSKEQNFKLSNNYFKDDLNSYSTEVQKRYKEADKKSQRYMKNKEYDKCAESIQKGINLLDRKDGYVYGIAQHRLTWCLYKSGNVSEARKQLEDLVTGNNVGQFSNGVKVATKARVDLYRLCMKEKDYDCVDRLESELIDIGSEKYTTNKTVDMIAQKIRSKYN